MTRLRADLVLIACAAIWGLAFVYQKTAMTHIGPLTFIAARGLIAACALAPLAAIESRQSPFPTPPAALLKIGGLTGMAFFVAAVLQQSGIVTSSVTNSGFLTALYVVVVPFIAWAWHRKAPGSSVWLAVILSFVGTWLLGGGSLAGLGHGDMMVAASAVFWAAHVVVVGISGRLGRPVAVTALQFLVVGVLGLAGALVFEDPRVQGLQTAAGEILFVGLLSSALTFTLLAVALRYTPPSEAAVLVSLETVFAALAGAILLGDRLPLIGWIGAAMIFTASLVVQLGARMSQQKP
jgi:drug/metabolite transporter (DMT)-like permease